MQNYELTLVLPESATSAKEKSVTAFVEKVIGLNKGKVGKVDSWGKIDLLYPIRKNNAGNFIHYQLELDPSGAKSLEDKIRTEEGIIRHLLVKKD